LRNSPLRQIYPLVPGTGCSKLTWCAKISVTIASFITETRGINDTIQKLHQELRSLSQILDSISLAWNNNPEIAAAQSGPDRALWVCVKDSMANCQVVLENFEGVINGVLNENEIGSSRGILKRSFSKVKLDFRMGDIDALRTEIETYHRVLGIALNSINV
jgi:hypothetical protein